MTRDKRNLILASLFIIACMLVIVPVSTALLGLQRGILLAMALYWFALCLPLAIHFQGWEGIKSSLRLTTNGASWIPALAIALPLMILGQLHYDLGPFMSIGLALTVLPAALINGTVEEVFWRGTYLKIGGTDNLFWGIGLVLFTAWHISLLFAVGAVHHGGAITLLGGAFALGLAYTFMVRRSQAIGWVAISHVLVNVVAFSMTLSQQT